jgi:hypothetical protein
VWLLIHRAIALVCYQPSSLCKPARCARRPALSVFIMSRHDKNTAAALPAVIFVKPGSVCLHVTNETTVTEGLQGPGWRAVRIGHGLDESESFAKFCANRGRVVTTHRKTAAAIRALRRKGPDDHRPAGSDQGAHVFDVPGSVLSCSQEMKGGTIVPDVHPSRRP